MGEQNVGPNGRSTDSSEKTERKMIVRWPDKQEMIARRNLHFKTNKDALKNEIRKEYLLVDQEKLESLSRIGLGAVFMIEEMQRISPIKLKNPIKIISRFKFQSTRDKGSILGVTLNGGTQELLIFYNTLDAMIDRDEEDLEILFMGAAVHEFAHLLYEQEGRVNRNIKKIIGWNENDGPKASFESSTEAYLAKEVEVRARIWQLNFLKRYFPNSVRRKSVEEMSLVGQRVSDDRLIPMEARDVISRIKRSVYIKS